MCSHKMCKLTLKLRFFILLFLFCTVVSSFQIWITHTHKGIFAEQWNFSAISMEEKKMKLEEVCNKRRWFCKFFIILFCGWSSSKKIFIWQSHAIKIRFNHELILLASWLLSPLLLMIHFKYLSMASYEEKREEMPFVCEHECVSAHCCNITLKNRD